MEVKYFYFLGLLLCLIAQCVASSSGEQVHDLAERAKVRAFLDTLSVNGANVDNIDIRISNVGGRGLFAAKALKKNDLIFSIPEKLWLGKALRKSHAVTDEVEDRPWPDILAAVLLAEKKNPSSLWKTWFDLLPTEKDYNTPLWWNDEEIAELQQSHIKYFSIQRRRQVENFYRDSFVNARPSIPALQWMKHVTLDELKWALSTVWSRNFGVAEKEFAIVPIGDFMNMQRPEGVTHPMVRADTKNRVVSYVANRDIEAGEEIFAPYGVMRPIPNTELLSDFGFVWDVNFYDGVPIKAEVAPADPLKDQKSRLRSIWQCHRPIIPLYFARVPDELICFARVLNANAEELKAAIANPDSFNNKPLSNRAEKAAYKWIKKEAQRMLRTYPTTLEFDQKAFEVETNSRIKNAISIRKREKEILHWLIEWANEERSKLTGAKKDKANQKDEL